MPHKGQMDELIQKLISLIPEGAKTLPKDIETHFRSALQSGFAQLNLVTRDEFDAQVKVLQRTRKKLEELEKELLERIWGQPASVNPTE